MMRQILNGEVILYKESFQEISKTDDLPNIAEVNTPHVAHFCDENIY